MFFCILRCFHAALYNVKVKNLTLKLKKVENLGSNSQRWGPRGRSWPRGRPRGHILKSLAEASKVKSLALASKSQVLENCPALGSRIALFSALLKFCWKTPKTSRKICEDLFFFFFFFSENTCACVLGLEQDWLGKMWEN